MIAPLCSARLTLAARSIAGLLLVGRLAVGQQANGDSSAPATDQPLAGGSIRTEGSASPASETEKTPLGLQLQLEGSLLSPEAIRLAIQEELGVLVVVGTDGPLRLTVAKAQLTMSYAAEGRDPIERKMTLPPEPDEQLEVIALLSHNLLRDEASELLALLTPAPDQGAAGSRPEEGSAPGENTQPVAGGEEATVAAGSPKEAGAAAEEAPKPEPLGKADVALMVTPEISYPQHPEKLEAGLVLGLLNAKVGYLRGFGASLLSLESQRGFRGFAAGLLLHRSRGPAAGASAALLLNRQGSESAESRGFQAALGYALTLGSLQGAQAALVARAKGQLSGAQFGLVSLSEGRVEGLQVGLVNAAGEGVRGLQLGLVNQAHGPARGLQLGLVNSARGGQTQIGLVNASKGKGARIGLVNVGHGVRPQLLLWASNSGLSIDAEWAGGFLGHVGLRTLTGGLLSMLSVGVGPGGCFPAQTACSGQQLRVAPGLTLGGRVSLSRQVKMEIDAQYRYSFETDDFLVGAHSLGPRISFTLEPTPAFGFFVGGGAEGTWTPEADSVWLMEQLFAGVSFF